MSKDELLKLAEIHEHQAIACAKNAASNQPWYHAHAADAARSANHFAIVAALRSLAQGEDNEQG